MVFRRRSSKGSIIDSNKHEIRTVALLANGGTVKEVVIAQGKDEPTGNNQVKSGSVIKAIIFEINFNFESNITAIIDWAIVKRKFGQTANDFDPAVPMAATRSGKFLWGMEMPAGINNSSSIKRVGTLLVPKGKQRMSEDDIWSFLYRSSAGVGQEDVCSHFIYKEYR